MTEMPKRCAECKFKAECSFENKIYEFCLMYNVSEKSTMEFDKNRPSWCPLIEIKEEK